MFRFVLPAALFVLGTSSGVAAPSDEATQQRDLQAKFPPCDPTATTGQHCMRVLACIGDDGLYFDGQARGDAVGLILGRTSDGVSCSGHWSNVHGTDSRGEGRARLKCGDGSRFHLVYDSRDRQAGTHIGVGKDSNGRMIRAWTGDDVLHFLSDENDRPSLKCGDRMVPLQDEARID